MITVLAVMLAGICIGFAVTNIPRIIRINDQLVTWAIFLLLFLLGISVGLNETIIKNLDTIGLQAAVITFGAISGSVLCSWLIYHFWFKPAKDGEMKHEE
jgi:uncharacterized membrane protein YbjE (DUF340 family)